MFSVHPPPTIDGFRCALPILRGLPTHHSTGRYLSFFVAGIHRFNRLIAAESVHGLSCRQARSYCAARPGSPGRNNAHFCYKPARECRALGTKSKPRSEPRLARTPDYMESSRFLPETEPSRRRLRSGCFGSVPYRPRRVRADVLVHRGRSAGADQGRVSLRRGGIVILHPRQNLAARSWRMA